MSKEPNERTDLDLLVDLAIERSGAVRMAHYPVEHMATNVLTMFEKAETERDELYRQIGFILVLREQEKRSKTYVNFYASWDDKPKNVEQEDIRDVFNRYGVYVNLRDDVVMLNTKIPDDIANQRLTLVSFQMTPKNARELAQRLIEYANRAEDA